MPLFAYLNMRKKVLIIIAVACLFTAGLFIAGSLNHEEYVMYDDVEDTMSNADSYHMQGDLEIKGTVNSDEEDIPLNVDFENVLSVYKNEKAKEERTVKYDGPIYYDDYSELSYYDITKSLQYKSETNFHEEEYPYTSNITEYLGLTFFPNYYKSEDLVESSNDKSYALIGSITGDNVKEFCENIDIKGLSVLDRYFIENQAKAKVSMNIQDGYITSIQLDLTEYVSQSLMDDLGIEKEDISISKAIYNIEISYKQGEIKDFPS